MTSTLRLERVPVSTLGALLEAAATHPGWARDQLAAFAGFSLRTGQKALHVLEELGLLRNDGGGYYVRVEGVKRGLSEESLLRICRAALLQYRPFELLLEGLWLGDTVPTAARKAALSLNLSNGEEKKFGLLVEWAIELGILEVTAQGVRIQEHYEPSGSMVPSPTISDADVASEAHARLFVVSFLGREIYDRLDEIDRALIVNALVGHQGSPRDSVDEAGQAVEDVLREICQQSGLAMKSKKCNGAGQLVQLLVTEGFLHGVHQRTVDAVAAARNTTAHKKDKKTLKPWEITPEAALTFTLAALLAIRSCIEYVEKGVQRL